MAEREQTILATSAQHFAAAWKAQGRAWWTCAVEAHRAVKQVGDASVIEYCTLLHEQENIVLHVKRLYEMIEVVERFGSLLSPEEAVTMRPSVLLIASRIPDVRKRAEVVREAEANGWTAADVRRVVKGERRPAPRDITGAHLMFHPERWPVIQADLARWVGTGKIEGFRPVTRRS